MLEATSKKKKIDEARKELEDGSKKDEDDDGGGLQSKGDLKSDYEHIPCTVTLLTWKQESPC